MDLVDKTSYLPTLTKELVKEYVLPIGIIKLQRIHRQQNLLLKNFGFKKNQTCTDCNKCYWYKPNDIS